MTRTDPTRDVVIVGGGIAGLTAGIFTARAGLDTLVVTHGESILERNAHLENFPGFPAGVNPRRLLDMTAEQARRSGCTLETGVVTDLASLDEGFTVSFESHELEFRYVIAASWSDSAYLAGLTERLQQGSKQFVETDADGRTDVPGLYAAGRVAGCYHQAVVAAGSGATAALTLLDDSEQPFYHDWVAPEGYFTERGRDVPPGVEEIADDERERREHESVVTMREHFAEPYLDDPTMHPSVLARRETEED